MTPAGFPHSDISGSTPACDSPKLFAANHVLHRLLTPRHSPCALSSLTTNLIGTPKGSEPPARSGSAKPPFAHWKRQSGRILAGLNCCIATFSVAIRRLQGRVFH